MKIFDAHLHAREADSAEFAEVMPIYSALSAGVYMMNFKIPLNPADLSAAMSVVRGYDRAIAVTAAAAGNPDHVALLMPVLSKNMRPDDLGRLIDAMRNEDIPLAGFKLFSPGQSTNSDYAPPLGQALELIDVVEERRANLALHLEDPDQANASAKEESAVRNILPKIVMRRDRRRDMGISIEHVSTAAGLAAAHRWSLNYTITPHHLGLCQEMLGIADPATAEAALRMQPYFLCKPIVQTMANVLNLRDAFISADDHLMLGSDSAPHIAGKKESFPPAAGIFMGPTAAAYRAVIGDAPNFWKKLENLSENAAKFYGLTPNALPEAKGPSEDSLRSVRSVRGQISQKMAEWNARTGR
jgi:dihydroorotase